MSPLLNTADSIRAGVTEAARVYQGDELVWEGFTPPPFSFSPWLAIDSPTFDLEVSRPNDVPSMRARMEGRTLIVTWDTSVTGNFLQCLGGVTFTDNLANPAHPLAGVDLSGFVATENRLIDLVLPPDPSASLFECRMGWLSGPDEDSAEFDLAAGYWDLLTHPGAGGVQTVDWAETPPVWGGQFLQGLWTLAVIMTPQTTIPAGEVRLTMPWAQLVPA
jgi:hypothetical protein